MALVVIAQSTVNSAERFTGVLIDGLALGAIYALLALGFVIIFKATQVLSFAHGALSAAGAYLVGYFMTVLNFPGRYMSAAPVTIQFILSAMVAVLAAAAVGMAIERLFIRPMIGEPLFSIAMITIGLDIVIRTITNDLLGQAAFYPVGAPWLANVLELSGGDIRIPHTQIATFVTVIIVFLGVGWFFQTRLGLAMRATAFDQEAAMAQGISAGRIFALAWGIGAGLAAIGGIFASVFPRAAGVTNTTFFFALRAFPAIILGGLDSIKGSIIGGFIIGLAEVFAGNYLSQFGDQLGIGFNTVVPYIVMIAVLLIRPYGLFGTPEIRRV